MAPQLTGPTSWRLTAPVNLMPAIAGLLDTEQVTTVTDRMVFQDVTLTGTYHNLHDLEQLTGQVVDAHARIAGLDEAGGSVEPGWLTIDLADGDRWEFSLTWVHISDPQAMALMIAQEMVAKCEWCGDLHGSVHAADVGDDRVCDTCRAIAVGL